jgi:hypothetical protein
MEARLDGWTQALLHASAPLPRHPLLWHYYACRQLGLTPCGRGLDLADISAALKKPLRPLYAYQASARPASSPPSTHITLGEQAAPSPLGAHQGGPDWAPQHRDFAFLPFTPVA